MKARLARVLVKQKNFIPLLFSFFACIGFSNNTIAQGWTFTFQFAQSGPCPANPPALLLPPLPNFGIPTKSQCESIRQTLLNIRSSFPVTNDRGNYIGECTLYLSCTPCTGSDIIIANQASSGDVSFNGQFTGEPLYSSHESSAFEDWSLDYKQQLAAYGITSILGNTLTAPQIPLTGDRDFDAFYNSQTSNFNPTTPPVSNPNSDPNVVDLSGKAGVVQLLRSPEDIKRENDWLQQQNIDDLKPIPKNAELDPIVLEPAPFWTSPEMVALEIAAAGFVLPFAIALVPTAALGMSVANAELLATPVFAFASENYKAMADVMNGKTPASAGQMIVNTATSSVTDLFFKKIDGGISKKITNTVVREISEKLPGVGATINSIWGPK